MNTKPQVQMQPAHLPQLEKLLRDIESNYSEMRLLLIEHREAISQADTRRIAACVQAEQNLAVRLSEIESRRAGLMRAITGQKHAKLTLTAVAERAPEPHKSALLNIAERLRSLMSEIVQKQEAIRLASLSLMSHMQGIVRQVAQHLSATGTYSRVGDIPTTDRARGLIDVTT